MLELVPPQTRFHRSFLEAADEFSAVGEEPYAGIVVLRGDDSFAGRAYTRAELGSLERFADMCAFVAGDEEPDAPRPQGWVPTTTRWIVDDDTYLGRIALRHALTELLLNWGGHIAYAVRPTARRQGHATEALRLMLPIASHRGIDPALVTCDVDHVASRRVIEANGGVYEDTRSGKLRFWVPTATQVFS